MRLLARLSLYEFVCNADDPISGGESRRFNSHCIALARRTGVEHQIAYFIRNTLRDRKMEHIILMWWRRLIRTVTPPAPLGQMSECNQQNQSQISAQHYVFRVHARTHAADSDHRAAHAENARRRHARTRRPCLRPAPSFSGRMARLQPDRKTEIINCDSVRACVRTQRRVGGNYVWVICGRELCIVSCLSACMHRQLLHNITSD